MGVARKFSIQKAKVNGGFDYFEPAKSPQDFIKEGKVPEKAAAEYLCEVARVKLVDTRNGGVLFAVEAKVLETDNPKVKVGATRNWACDPNKDAGPGNIKEFLAAVLGIDASDTAAMEASDDWDETFEGAIVEEGPDANPLAGQKLRVTCSNRLLKDKPAEEAKSYFNLCKFRPE